MPAFCNNLLSNNEKLPFSFFKIYELGILPKSFETALLPIKTSRSPSLSKSHDLITEAFSKYSGKLATTKLESFCT